VQPLLKKIQDSPLWIRVAPFVFFLLITVGQGKLGEASKYWLYFAKTFAGIGLIWFMWPKVTEMRWAFSWEAVVMGVLVCVMWIGIDPYYPQTEHTKDSWNPFTQFGNGSALAWMFVIVRILGSTIIVPPLEEVFYRSFLYRYIVKPDFMSVPLNVFHPMALAIAPVIFGGGHVQWLAGILCGLAYQWLVMRKNRLGDAMTAHAITNFLLGVWVVWRGDWKFW
jgi:CAAX prenyl protease-like protein